MSKPKKKPTPRGPAVETLPCLGLARAREVAGYLSARAAAESLGIPVWRWQKWEQRQKAPRDVLETIADAWGVSLDDLADAAPDEQVEIERLLKSLGTSLRELQARFRRFLSERT